jgi:hypothetical protein
MELVQLATLLTRRVVMAPLRPLPLPLLLLRHAVLVLQVQ